MALFAMLASVCLLLGCTAAQPLHRAPASIRASLIKRTPIGTRYEAVEAFVKKEGWQPNSYTGLVIPFQLRAKDNAGNAPTVEVRQTMQVHLGDYGGLLPFYWHEVYGYWLFDINNQLIEVCVIKRIMDL